jgi:hypothetical protein
MPVLSRRRLLAMAIPTVVLLLLPAYLHAYKLSGASDAPTLLPGDTAIVIHAYWITLPYSGIRVLHVSRPKRGDLVLVRRPDSPPPPSSA